MKTGLIIGIIAVIAVLIIGGVYFALNSRNYGTSPATGSNNAGNIGASSGGNTVASSGNSVEISNFAFSPATLTIKAGDTVVWTNQDSVSHTVTSDSGSELGSSTLGNGQTYSRTFNTAGTYSYHCSIHTYMKAKIIVQ